jgi:cytochrome c oxidase subunit 2
LQDANRPLIEELTQLHDFINLVLVFVLTFVGVIMILMVAGKHINQNLLEMQMVEWVWTLIPAALLLQIALPSLLLLYMLDESVDRTLTLKTLGHQWY